MSINLGDKVRDTVTGFTGIAVGKTVWIHGCTRITVAPPVKKDGTLPDSASFDEPQLEVIKPKEKKEGNHKTGGPRPEVGRQMTPSRH